MKLLAGIIILAATTVQAAVLVVETIPAGPLGGAITANTTATTDQLQFATNAKNRGVIFTVRNTAGTATVEIQQNCTGNAADWAQVPNSPRTLTVSSGIVPITYPACQYRAWTTACTTCNVLVFYNTQPDI